MGRPPAESLADAKAILDRALESPKGVRVFFSSEREAKQFRQRIYAARLRDREQTRKTRPFGDPLRGKSPYDYITVFTSSTGAQPNIWFVEVYKADKPHGATSVEEIE